MLRLRIKEAPASGYNDNSYIVDNFVVSAIPEGGRASLLALGLLLGGLRARRRLT